MFSSLNIDHITTLLFIWQEKNLFFSNFFDHFEVIPISRSL